MDRVRLGRALGFGARAAAKTLVQAADAAMSPNPKAATKSSTAQKNAPIQPRSATAHSVPRRTGNIGAAASRMGRTVLEPVKRHSRELWLEVTGGFFALLACSMATGMWALHKTVFANFQTAHANHAALWSSDAVKFYVAAIAFLMFAYFAISNFVRVSRSSAAYKAQQHRKQ